MFYRETGQFKTTYAADQQLYPILQDRIALLLLLLAALVGIAFGLPSLRIKGFYLAVATLAAQFFIPWLLVKVSWFSNYSASGVITTRPIDVLGFVFDTPVRRYLLVLAIVSLFALLAK